MRARSLALLVAVAGCVRNPDPRSRPVDLVARDGHGGWIVVTDRHDHEIAGELIAIDLDAVRVLRANGLVSIAQRDIESARVWGWDSAYGGIAAWGGIGAFSTVTHGFFLVLSAPLWIVTGAVTAAVVSRGPVVTYPDDSWAKLAVWARFPQGAPPGLFVRDLVPGAPAAGSGAGSGSAALTPEH